MRMRRPLPSPSTWIHRLHAVSGCGRAALGGWSRSSRKGPHHLLDGLGISDRDESDVRRHSIPVAVTPIIPRQDKVPRAVLVLLALKVGEMRGFEGTNVHRTPPAGPENNRPSVGDYVDTPSGTAARPPGGGEHPDADQDKREAEERKDREDPRGIASHRADSCAHRPKDREGRPRNSEKDDRPHRTRIAARHWLLHPDDALSRLQFALDHRAKVARDSAFVGVDHERMISSRQFEPTDRPTCGAHRFSSAPSRKLIQE